MQREDKKEGYQKYTIYDEHGGGEGDGIPGAAVALFLTPSVFWICGTGLRFPL